MNKKDNATNNVTSGGSVPLIGSADTAKNYLPKKSKPVTVTLDLQELETLWRNSHSVTARLKFLLDEHFPRYDTTN